MPDFVYRNLYWWIGYSSVKIAMTHIIIIYCTTVSYTCLGAATLLYESENVNGKKTIEITEDVHGKGWDSFEAWIGLEMEEVGVSEKGIRSREDMRREMEVWEISK